MLADSDVHRLPVLDEGRQLLGVVTQSDLLAALFRMSLLGTAPAARAG